MDIKQLRYFTEVAERSSFTRAAATLRIAQPALSRQVKLLEEELGLQLLHRNGRGVSLTAAGAALFDRSSHLVAELADLRRDMIKRARGDVGAFTVGLPASISAALAPPLTAQFRRHLPDIAVRFIAGHSGLLPDWLTGGSIDLAVLFADPQHSRMVCQTIGSEELFALVAPNSPLAEHGHLTGVEVAGLTLVMPQRPHAMWDVMDRNGIRVGRHVSTDIIAEAVRLVRDGEAVAVRSLLDVAGDLAEARLRAVPIRQPTLRRTIVMCQPVGHKTGTVARQVASTLQAELRAMMRGGIWPAATAAAGRG